MVHVQRDYHPMRPRNSFRYIEGSLVWAHLPPLRATPRQGLPAGLSRLLHLSPRSLFHLVSGQPNGGGTGDKWHARMVGQKVCQKSVSGLGSRERQIHKGMEVMGEPALPGLRVPAEKLRVLLVITQSYVSIHSTLSSKFFIRIWIPFFTPYTLVIPPFAIIFSIWQKGQKPWGADSTD